MKPKFSKLAAAMLAVGAAGSAQAVTENADGLGQALIYPYYNVNNNFQTNVHLVNTKNEYKIVKLRIRESGNSQDVLDFNIYMSPYDVWTGVIRNVDGKANLTSNDNTCTLPANDAPVAFATDAGTVTGVLNDPTSGWPMNTVYPDVDDSDAREGYIEILEVGVIPDDTWVDMTGNNSTSDDGDRTVNSGLKHGSDGVPADCTVVTNAWTDTHGVSAGGQGGASVTNWGGMNNVAGLDAPTGGLYGHSIFLNVATGAAYVAQATAIDNWSTRDQHFRPDDATNFLLPSLASGDVTSTLVVDPSTDSALSITDWPAAVDATLNDGDTNTPASGTNPFPVAHVLQASAIVNDFFIDPVYDGRTDWVVTFPMRKHGIFNGQYTEDCDGEGGGSTSTTPGTEGTNTCFENRAADVAISARPFDREEQEPAPGGFGVSPVIGTPDTILPREVNILTFNGDSVLGSDKAVSVQLGADFVDGWMMMTFNSKYCFTESQLSDGTADFGVSDGTEGGTGLTAQHNGQCGVPAIGFAALQGNNPVGSSFGETIDHRFMRNMTPNIGPGAPL
ncbi:MAG: hypothetical protein ACPW60_11215 [Methylohalobius sp. ZOD2]